MKTFPSNFSIVMAIALIGAAGFYIGHKTAPQPQVPIVATAPAEAPAAAPPRPVEPVGALPAAAPAAAPVAAATDASVSKEPPAVLAAGDAAFQRALGSLLQTNATVREKMAVWRELRSKGQLDDALSYLEEAAANNPGNAAYPTALAEGCYTKLQSVYGKADSSTVAILALQTDQSFNDALQINPSSWEAQYVKADALSHWPADMNKGPEVVQQLSSLIDQQDGQSPQPQFAQSYVLLGDEYQKLGQGDFATATWQLGLQKYPGNETLQTRIKAGHP